MSTQSSGLSRQKIQPRKLAFRNRFAMSWFASSSIQSPRTKMPSSSAPVPRSDILKTFSSSSVYSSPVSGFSTSSTCASSLYVIAAAASTSRLRRSSIENGWAMTSTSSCGSIPFFVSAANSLCSLPLIHTPTFLPRSFVMSSRPVSFHVTSVIPERV